MYSRTLSLVDSTRSASRNPGTPVHGVPVPIRPLERYTPESALIIRDSTVDLLTFEHGRVRDPINALGSG
ncbi:hypothetical protein FRC07_009389 [Ceratobasidium sp. 392]|nr:hypothetical protein FRC07_009389 [Ceratobasidium sp. 392]